MKNRHPSSRTGPIRANHTLPSFQHGIDIVGKVQTFIRSYPDCWEVSSHRRFTACDGRPYLAGCIAFLNQREQI